MSALVTVTPATVAAKAAACATAKAAAAARWAANDRPRRKLEGRLRNCPNGRIASELRKQLGDVRRMLRQDAWAVGK